jgi:ABC-type oligopeptide transport system substrate-binding subunit
MAHYSANKPLPTVTFAVPRDPPVFALAVALKNAWERALGVTILLHQLNAATYTAVLKARVFDLAIVRWGGDYPDLQDFLGTQLGASADNVTGWTTRQYDRTVQRAGALAPSDPTRLALFRAAARLAAQKLPILPLDVPAQTAVISPLLRGVELTPLGTIDGDWTRARFR